MCTDWTSGHVNRKYQSLSVIQTVLRANTIIASCWPRPRQKNCSPPDSFPDSEAPMSTRAQGWPLRLWTSSRHSFLRQWTRCLGSAASSRGLRRCCWRARQTTRSCCWSVPTGPLPDWSSARTRRSSCAIRSARRDSLQPCRAASRSRCWRARFVALLPSHPISMGANLFSSSPFNL